MIIKRAKNFLVFITVFCFYVTAVCAMEHDALAVNIAQTQTPRSPLRAAVIAGNEPLVRELLSTGVAEVDEVDAQQRTALHIMLAGSDTPRTQKMVRLLLELKASIEHADNYGIRPLDYAHLQSFAMHTLVFNWLRKEDKAVIQEV